MKKFILFHIFLCLFFTDTYAYKSSSPVDSIIVNIGARKRIVLWGATREDLRALEKYDLNKIVIQMNQDLEEMPNTVRRSVRQDYEGDSYTKGTTKNRALQQLSSWQRLTRNTYLNFSIGFNTSNVLALNTTQYNPYQINETLFYQHFFTSPALNLALVRQESFVSAGHKEFVLRYGFDLSWYFYEVKVLNKKAYLLKANNIDNTRYDTVAVYKPAKNGANYYEIENLTGNIQPEVVSPTTFNQSLLYANFRLIPTINFYGKNNQKTFTLGIGTYLGMLLSGNKIFPEIRALNQLQSKIRIKNRENPYRYGVVVNVGYSIVNLFLETDIKKLLY